MSKGKLTKAMILSAGFGTRLRPLTDNIPKALIMFNGRPMIENVILKLINFGITDIVVNTHHLSEKIADYFSSRKFDASVTLIHEERILGTGGGIKNARKNLEDSGDFLVHNVDVDTDLDLNEMYKFHEENNAIATLAVQKRETSRPLIIDSKNNLIGRTIYNEDLIYGKTPFPLSKIAFSGIHILSSRIFNFFPAFENFDIISFYMELNVSTENIVVYDIGNCYWRDLGKTS